MNSPQLFPDYILVETVHAPSQNSVFRTIGNNVFRTIGNNIFRRIGNNIFRRIGNNIQNFQKETVHAPSLPGRTEVWLLSLFRRQTTDPIKQKNKKTKRTNTVETVHAPSTYHINKHSRGVSPVYIAQSDHIRTGDNNNNNNNNNTTPPTKKQQKK